MPAQLGTTFLRQYISQGAEGAGGKLWGPRGCCVSSPLHPVVQAQCATASSNGAAPLVSSRRRRSSRSSQSPRPATEEWPKPNGPPHRTARTRSPPSTSPPAHEPPSPPRVRSPTASWPSPSPEPASPGGQAADVSRTDPWTPYLAAIHSARSLQAVLDLAVATSWAGEPACSGPPPPHAGVSERVHWGDVDPGLRAKAVAAVDTLELLAEGLKAAGPGRARSSSGSSDSGSDADNSSMNGRASPSALGPGPLPSAETVETCTGVVQHLLELLAPLLRASALRPKHLASLARAINSLAAAAPATNQRQAVPSGASGFLATPRDPSPPPPVLVRLPADFAAAYGAAVAEALPHTSPAALCYLLRAVSLDRGKRLLRAAKHLSPRLASRAAQLAPDMNASQAAVVVSCGAQLAWPVDADGWLQAVLARLEVCAAAEGAGGRLAAANAAAVLHALGQLRAPPSASLASLLFTSLAAALPARPADPSAKGAPAEPPLTPLQLSSSLWAAARLSLPIPELWLQAFTASTYPLLKDGGGEAGGRAAAGFSPAQLANCMWAMASLQWAPAQRWMDAFMAALQAGAPAMRPGEIAMVAWALGHIRFRPSPEVCESVIEAAAQRAASLDMRQLAMLLVACARINYKPKAETAAPLTARLLDLLAAQFGASPAPGTPKPRPSTPSGAGAARTQEPEPATPQTVANLCWATCHLDLPSHRAQPEVVRGLARAAATCLPLFNMGELGMVGQSLGTMAVRAQRHAAQEAESREGGGTEGGGQLRREGRRPARRRSRDRSRSPSPVPAPPPLDTQPLVEPFLAAGLTQLKALQRQQRGWTRARRAGIGPNQPAMAGRRTAPLALQCSGLLLAAVKLAPGYTQPPAPWMDLFYQVTEPSLLAWQPRELEVLAEALRLMKPPPQPPLPWVRAFSDRRDQLSVASRTPKHLKAQLLLALRIMRREWQAAEQRRGADGGGGDEVPAPSRPPSPSPPPRLHPYQAKGRQESMW